MSRHRVSSACVSVFPLKADIHQRGLHVRFVPIADLSATLGLPRYHGIGAIQSLLNTRLR